MGGDGSTRGGRFGQGWSAGLGLAVALAASVPSVRGADGGGRFDGPDNCAECHRPMHATWMHTAHYGTFTSAHRMRSGRRVAGRLGIERIKQSEDCARCHYTAQTRPLASGGRLPVAGVSCESCHGPAGKWNAIHADPTDPDALEKAEALGLIRPGNIGGMAHQCFKCHTVNDERLVNLGGHNPGSDFEMVAWLEGEVRHNFIDSKGARNAPTPVERKRLFYVVGQIVALERAIAEFADATEAGDFASIRVERRAVALKRLEAVQRRVKLEVLGRVIETGVKAVLKRGDDEALRNAAGSLRRLAQEFAEGRDGSELAAIDELLPRAEDYLGDVFRP